MDIRPIKNKLFHRFKHFRESNRKIRRGKNKQKCFIFLRYRQLHKITIRSLNLIMLATNDLIVLKNSCYFFFFFLSATLTTCFTLGCCEILTLLISSCPRGPARFLPSSPGRHQPLLAWSLSLGAHCPFLCSTRTEQDGLHRKCVGNGFQITEVENGGQSWSCLIEQVCNACTLQ